MFPEGLSRYYPEMASLKQGVARLVSDVLARHEHDPDFKLAIQTCSITCTSLLPPTELPLIKF